MDSALWIGIIGIALVILAHVVTTVWWAAKITTILTIAQTSLESLATEMKAVNKTYVSKEDFSRELAIKDKEIAAMWKRIDEIKHK